MIASVPDRTTPAGLSRFIPGHVLEGAKGPAWTDLIVQVLTRPGRQPPFRVPAVAEPLIVWIMSGPARVEERDLGGQWVTHHVDTGDIFVTRTPDPYEMRWETSDGRDLRVMHAYLSIPLFESVAAEVLGTSAQTGVREIAGERDATLSAILSLIHTEMGAEEACGPYVRGLALSLAGHLVRTYGTTRGVPPTTGLAMPALRLRRALAFMEDHLADPFTLDDVAAAAGMSRSHFSRQFRRSVGLSPSQHFIALRMARAQILLKESELSMIEIAMAVGYTSPSHFAYVFHREVGCSPSEYRAG